MMSIPTLDLLTEHQMNTVPKEGELEDYFADLENGADDPEIRIPPSAELLEHYYRTPEWLIRLGQRKKRQDHCEDR